MQYCKRCKITVRNSRRKCPLCQGNLEGNPEEENRMFPDLRRESSRMAMGFRIFSFVCIAVCVAAVSVNWILGFHSFWSGYVLAGVGCMWILSAVAIVKRRNLFKNAVWEAVLLWAVFLFWDFITGWRGWSVDFGIPIVLLAVYAILWSNCISYQGTGLALYDLYGHYGVRGKPCSPDPFAMRCC